MKVRRATNKSSRRKERITVSLSRDAARFLRALRAEARAPSLSALFEKIVSDIQGKSEMKRLDDRIKAYYDLLPEAIGQEDSAWGALGEEALASQAEEERREERRPRLAGAKR